MQSRPEENIDNEQELEGSEDELNSEEEAALMEMFTSFLSQRGFFAVPGVGAAGEVKVAELSESESELHRLINDVCNLQGNPKFTETDQAYLDLLKQVETHLTAHPGDINSRESNFLVTPMHTAGGAGLFELVKVLIKFNPDLSLTNCLGETPSERARGYAGRDDIADFLDTYIQENKKGLK